MYYKIINKDCEVYQKLFKQRKIEIQAQEDNKKLIDEVVDFKWKTFYGHVGQQTFSRVTEYTAFVPCDENEVDLKEWRKSKQYKNGYVPNLRTKKGRIISEKLEKGIKGFNFSYIWRVLGAGDVLGNFTLPYVEIADDIIIIFLDNRQEPRDENVIEITKKEFEELFKNIRKVNYDTRRLR